MHQSAVPEALASHQQVGDNTPIDPLVENLISQHLGNTAKFLRDQCPGIDTANHLTWEKLLYYQYYMIRLLGLQDSADEIIFHKDMSDFEKLVGVTHMIAEQMKAQEASKKANNPVSTIH